MGFSIEEAPCFCTGLLYFIRMKNRRVFSSPGFGLIPVGKKEKNKKKIDSSEMGWHVQTCSADRDRTVGHNEFFHDWLSHAARGCPQVGLSALNENEMSTATICEGIGSSDHSKL